MTATIIRSLRNRSHHASGIDAGPPGPGQRYPGYFLRRLASDRLGLFAEMARHGDVSQIMVRPGLPVVLLVNPDDIQRLLVTEQRSFLKGPSLGLTRELLGNGLLTNEGDSV